MGTHHKCTMVVHVCPHGHPAASTIMGDHTCATWATKTATLWTPTCVSTYIHEIGRPCTPTHLHELPRLASTGTHHRPRTPTKFWTPTLHGGVPRFGPPHLSTATHKPRPPSSTACYGHPRILDSHHVIWATTESLWPWTSTLVHKVFGRPCNHLGAHAIMWASSDNGSWPSTRYVWIPMTFCGWPGESLGVHGILWASTYDMWTAKSRLFWATTHISWAPNNDKPWAPNYVANSTHFGQPRHYRWSPTLLHWPPTILFGRPRSFMDAQ